MCSVSAVHDFAQTIPPGQWTRPMFDEYQRVIDKLEEIDRKLSLPDCGAERKTKFMRQIEERLKKLEDTVKAGVAQ